MKKNDWGPEQDDRPLLEGCGAKTSIHTSPCEVVNICLITKFHKISIFFNPGWPWESEAHRLMKFS